MSSLYLIKNPLKPFEREHFEHEGPIIDLLQEIAPTGFGMPIRAFVNGDEIELDDLDIAIKDDDIAAVIVSPGFDPISAIIIAVVSSIISLTLNLLFAPKSPKTSENNENPTYNINVLKNEARLGRPIPVVYGELWTTPDYAARPYRFYTTAADNWSQYLDMLVCVGCGEFEEITLDDIKIGNTTINDTAAVSVKQFHKGAARGNILSHKGKFGNIQKELWKTGFQQGEAPIFLEACYTSPEVGDWLFTDDSTTVVSTTTMSVEWVKKTSNTGADAYFIRVARADYTTLVGNNARQVTIAGSSLGNDGTYYLGYVVDDGASATIDLPLYTVTRVPTIGTDSIQVTTSKSTNGMTAGPYWTTPNSAIKTDYIYLDFVAENGIYWVHDDGSIGKIGEKGRDSEIPKFTIDIYSPSGAKVQTSTYTFTDIYGVRQPIRITVPIRIDGGGTSKLPADRYKVKVRASYTISTMDRLQNSVKWVGLRSTLSGYIGNDAYGDSTILAVRIKATNGIAAQSQNQLRVRARRRYKLADGSVGVSSNPIDAAHDILVNDDYGASQPSSTSGTDVFLDWPSFNDCRQLWDGYKTDSENYPSFNASFATADTVWQALQSALSVAVARPVMDHGQVKVVRDSIKPYRSFMFNASNIVLDSLVATYQLSPEHDEDHVQIEYRDDDLMEPAYAIYPTAAELGKTPVSPFKIKLFGCTDGDYAKKYARLIYNRRLYQRKTVNFQTEMDGMLPLVGDRILVSSPQIRWGISGMVRYASKTSSIWTLTLDAIPDWQSMQTSGANAFIVLTDIQGRVSTRVRINPTSAKDEHVELQTEPTYPDGTPFEIDISGARDPARFAILLSSGENGRDMEITSIDHQGGNLFRVNAVHYEVKQDNTGHAMYDGVPEHMKLDYDGSNLI